MKKIFTALALFLVFSTSAVFAQRTITIKMSSQTPESTPWGNYLNQLAADWKKISNGQVELVIFHGRTVGNEETVVQMLRVNQLQAAVLSTFGLAEIAPEVMTLSSPFTIRDDDELDLVLNEVKPELEDRIKKKGFFTLAWSRVGWVKFFSKTPIFTPADLKKVKLGTLSEYDKLNQVFRAMGFQMVPVAQQELIIALNSPMVDAIYNSLIAVGSTQAFGLAKNLASVNVAPFMGAIVINQRAWNSIPDTYKPQMIEAVRKREAELDRAVRKFEADMMQTMGNYGLTINQLSPEQEQLWWDEGKKALPSLVGSLFDKDIYNRIESLLQNYRKKVH